MGCYMFHPHESVVVFFGTLPQAWYHAAPDRLRELPSTVPGPIITTPYSAKEFSVEKSITTGRPDDITLLPWYPKSHNYLALSYTGRLPGMVCREGTRDNGWNISDTTDERENLWAQLRRYFLDLNTSRCASASCHNTLMYNK